MVQASDSPSTTGTAPAQQLLATLNRVWRLVGTALSFSAFGIGGIVLGLLVLPIICPLTPRRHRRRVARRMVSGGFLAFVELMRILRVLDYHIEGRDKLRDLGGCLIVANHPSLIDVVFLLAIFRDADCVVKAAHWSNPFTMAAVRWAGYLSNADPTRLVDDAVQRLRHGGHLVLFPEGSRSVPNQPLDFRRGAAMITLAAEAPCIPVLIRCTPTTLTKGEPWYHIPRRRVCFQMRIQAPLVFTDPPPGTATARQTVIARTEQLAAYYADALARLDGNPAEQAKDSS